MTPADVLPPEVDSDDVPPEEEVEVESRPVVPEPDVVEPSGIVSRKASGRLQAAARSSTMKGTERIRRC
jgi:hypothetical protein